MNNKLYTILWIFCCILITLPSQAQKRKKSNSTNSSTYSSSNTFDEKTYNSLEWRCIGPFRGGRSCAVTGVSGKPNLFYFGATGGGVWRTKDGGSNWENISDGYFGGSIGAVAVSEYDNNVIYVGGGEKTVRGNVSYGYGMWKSTNAGKSWEQIGLTESRHISRVRIHPKNPDLAFAAVMGDLYKSHTQRGIFRTKDGGKTWQKVLFVNDDTGAVDLTFDPSNPRILYATTWQVRRTPYSFSSGGEGSGLWKSTDGGDTWVNISERDGLPKGTLGISGIAVSPVNSERVWAIIEAKEGGVFRSDNAGKTWQKVNSERKLRQRAWYYTRIYADTQDENGVYVLNVSYHKSTDGGKTFTNHYAPHGDHHDLWIAPENNERMIIGDDGGAQTSFDGGDNWSTYMNQPTAQFYRVTTDNHFPYRIYAAQQDNSAIRILHRTTGSAIGEKAWESTAGGESAHLAVDPLNNDIVYGGSYGGFLTRKDHKTQQTRGINVWPDNPMGHGAEGMKFRFQWNFPIFFSPHNPKRLYTCSNHLHVTENEGESWDIISPDLTRNDSTKLGPSGGPITKDNTGVEYYCTIFAAVESPHEEGTIWTGSDDGLIHITRNGGKDWSNVTPPNLPTWAMINTIEADPFEKGGAYVAATLYKSGDYRPYLYKTKNYGQTWTKITNGIDNQYFTRVIRADPERQGLLYAGTESGMYVSFNDGANWQPLQLNLPIVPITDLAVKDNNLIAATQGRSLWIIDDLTVLHQQKKEITRSDFHLYQPMNTYKMGGWSSGPSKTAGTNHKGGVMVHFYVKETTDSTKASLEFLEADGDLIRKFSTDAKDKADKLSIEDSTNLFVWNMRYPAAEKFEGMVMWWASLNGPRAVPGKYKVRLTVDEVSQEQEFEILKDPRAESSQEDLQAQFDFLMDIRDKISETHTGIKNIRDVRKQLSAFKKKIEGQEDWEDLGKMAGRIDSSMTVIEKTLYQTQNQSRQDPLNFPIRLNNKLGHLTSIAQIGDFRPTQQAIAVKDEMAAAIDEQLAKLKLIFEKEVADFNAAVKAKAVDTIIIKEEEAN